MAQRPSFDMGRMSTGSKILAGASALFFIDSFLPWNRVCVGGGTVGGIDIPGACISANLWHGVGILAALLAIVLLVEEGLKMAGVAMKAGTPVGPIVLSLSVGVLVFTILKVIIDSEFLSFGAWVGIVLSVAIAYGGYMRFQEEKAGMPPPAAPPPAPGGGFTP
jgi:hypothetical protein